MENSLLWIPVTLFIKEILELVASGMGYRLNSFNVRCVQITGIITAKDLNRKFIEYAGKSFKLNIVDDGTGVLNCIHWKDHMDVKLGDLVTIKGKVQDFRNKRQLNITHIIIENDPNIELLRNLTTITNHDIYDMPNLNSQQGFTMSIAKVKRQQYSDHVYNNCSYLTDSGLTGFIHARLNEEFADGSFTYNQILQESKIMEYALSVLSGQFNESNPSSSRISSLLKKSVSDLTKQGDLCKFKIIGLIILIDEYDDIYSLVNDIDLDQIVHNWLKQESCLELLVSKLREESKYQHATRSRVKNAVGRLIEQGLIYEREKDVYVCV